MTTAFATLDDAIFYQTFDTVNISGSTAYEWVSGNDGTITGALNNATGVLDEGLYFDGNDKVEHSDLGHGANTLSGCGWVTFNDNGWQAIAVNGNRGTDRSWEFVLAGDKLRYAYASASGSSWQTVVDSTSASLFSVGTEYAICFTHSGTSIKFYVDGSQVSETLSSGSNSTNTIRDATNNKFTIGFDQGSFYGKIDVNDFIIFDRELSSSEISDHYDSGSGVNPFVTGATDPVISITQPLNLTYFNSATNSEQDFIYAPEDNGSTIDDCTIYTNRTGSWSNTNMQTDNSPTAGANNTLNPAIALTTGTYKWAVRCEYGTNNFIFSDNYTVYVDYTDPVITLNAPADNYYEKTTPSYLNYSVSDNFGGSIDCNITQNGVMVQSASVTSGNSQTYSPVTGEATNTWYVNCQDDAGNFVSSVNRTHTRDNTAPTTTLVSPNGTISYTGTMDFVAVADDNLNEDAGTWTSSVCNLYINGSLNISGFTGFNLYNTTASPLSSPTTVFDDVSFPVGNYTYLLSCKDEAGNLGNSTTLSFSVESAISTLNVTFLNSTDNATITDSVQVILNNGTADVYTNSTTAGFLYYYNLTPGNYTATVSSADYDTQNQNVEIGTASAQSLTVYLVTATTPTNDTTLTFRNLYTNTVLENVTLAIEKNISGVWTLVDSESSDVNGRVTYTYEIGEGYRFTATKSDYESKIFTLEPISFSSYLIKLEPNTSGGGDDFGRVSVVYTPTTFTENSSVDFNVTFASPSGSLEFFAYNVSYKNYSIAGNGTNAYGGSLTDTIGFPFASGTDRVRVYYSFQLTGSPFREYVVFYELQDFTPEEGTIDASDLDATGLTMFEKAILSTIILAIGVGLAWLYSGILGAGLVAELLLGFLAYQGFMTWLVAIPSMILLFFLIMRGVGR